MPRLPQVSRSEVSDGVVAIYNRLFGDRDPVMSPGTATGTLGNWWTVMANHPSLLMQMVEGFRFLSDGERALHPRFRELGLVRAGFVGGSQFVFSQHCKAARAAGLSEEKIASIPTWVNASAFDDAERAVLAYADELLLADGRVQDATFEALSKHLSPIEILELSYAACLYRLHATLSRALQLEFDDVPERVLEVAAPDAAASSDVMGDISVR